jgi:predicted ABC-type ATPase
MTEAKKIIIIAGPNGAGKTTFAKNFLPREAHTLRFINADLIAAGLAPFNPESISFKAARLMLNELDEYTESGESFAFETTLSGSHYLQRIEEWRNLGYVVKLWFIALSSPEIAISRVAERVAQGGHNIPEDVIRRRFKAGLENFLKYQKAVNSWVLFDGDSAELETIAQG